MNNQKTDLKKLHLEFIRLGMMRRKFMNRMLLILPEIYESGIWKNYAESIYEYAGRFGGISGSAVEKRLRLERHLQDKPALKAAIADIGINKVAMVVTMATAKTDEIFADKVLNMSKSAIQVLSKELRMKESPTDIELCHAQAEKITLELDEDMTFMFLKLKNKYGISTNREMMRKILGMVEGGIVGGEDGNLAKQSEKSEVEGVTSDGVNLAEESGKSEVEVVTGDGIGAEESKKSEAEVVISDGILAEESIKFEAEVVTGDGMVLAEESAKSEVEVVTSDWVVSAEIRNTTRYISARLKRILPDKCSYPGCNKPRKNIHHTDRFSTSKSHKSISSLCKEHHEFMHNGLIENENYPKYWTLNLSKTPNQIDQLYRKYRREAKLFESPIYDNSSKTATAFK